MTTLEPPAAGDLEALIDSLRPRFSTDRSDWPDALSKLSGNSRGVSRSRNDPAHNQLAFDETYSAALHDFMVSLRRPIEYFEQSGLLADPWGAASLRRNEVRNAAVLSWFLDPRGDHGCGDALLLYVLERVRYVIGDQIPAKPSTSCKVAVEECPDGENANRVDILIDDDQFVLIFEVKIDATEQDEQLKRYCGIAAARAGSKRHWAVIFLTTDGRAPKTAGVHISKVILLSWKDIAAALGRVALGASTIPKFLASSFANHITRL